MKAWHAFDMHRRRKTALWHWCHFEGRSQTAGIEVARPLTPEGPHAWSFSPATTHLRLAHCRLVPLGRTWSTERRFYTGKIIQALLIRTHDKSSRKQLSINWIIFSYRMTRLERNNRRKGCYAFLWLRSEKMTPFNIRTKPKHCL